MEDFDNQVRFGVWNLFAVSDEADGFRLSIGGYSGDSGTVQHAKLANLVIFNIYSETWELGTPRGLAKNCPEF